MYSNSRLQKATNRTSIISVALLNFTAAIIATFLVSTVTISSDSFAQGRRGRTNQRIVLRFNRNIYRGNNSFYLKREIQRQHPDINVFNIKLESVRLVAITENGYGTAQLRVGGMSTREVQVYGNPDDFQYPRGNYDRINFNNPSRYNQNMWEMKIRGTFKIRRMVIFVSQENGGPFGGGGIGGPFDPSGTRKQGNNSGNGRRGGRNNGGFGNGQADF